MKRPPVVRRAVHAARGVMLLEVLMAVLIFSVGLIGLVGLQARAHQYSMSAEDTNRAALLANEIASAMWSVQSTTLPAATYSGWQARVADPTVNGLTNGSGTVSVSGNVATVTITWKPPSAAASAASNRYVTQVLIP